MSALTSLLTSMSYVRLALRARVSALDASAACQGETFLRVRTSNERRSSVSVLSNARRTYVASEARASVVSRD